VATAVFKEGSSGRYDARLRRISKPTTPVNSPISSKRRRESSSRTLEVLELASLDFEEEIGDGLPIHCLTFKNSDEWLMTSDERSGYPRFHRNG
jgi:hypothetical protein